MVADCGMTHGWLAGCCARAAVVQSRNKSGEATAECGGRLVVRLLRALYKRGRSWLTQRGKPDIAVSGTSRSGGGSTAGRPARGAADGLRARGVYRRGRAAPAPGMGLSEGWPSEAERLAARLQRWAAACSGYRKLRSCRISRGRQTMAQGADSDEDAAVSVGVGVGAGAGAAPGTATEAAAASRCLQGARPPRRSRPVGIKMFLTADEQAAIADAKSARPKHTVAHVTGNTSGAAAGVVLLAEQRVETREACGRQPNRVLLIQRPAVGQAAAAGGGGGGGGGGCPRAPCPSIARPRPACPRRPRHHTEPLLPPSGLSREPPPQPAGELPAAAAATPRSASLEESAPGGGGHSCGVGPAPPTLQVEDAEEWCGVAPSRESSASEPEEEAEVEPAAAGKRHGGRIEVSLYSGGSQREDILSVSVEAEEPAMVRGCGLRKTAPPASVRRPPPPADKATAGDPAIGRELGAGGRLVTRVDPRGRRELWWVSAAPPASPAPTPKRTASPAGAGGGLSGELRGLLSFRRARRLAQQQQLQLARRRVVAAADARDRRQWPAVLLTFERGVSPEPGCGPPSPHALLAARKARLEVAAV
ncbi:translation initiation factor IF-2-like [Schistocerca americana]|uniref:translation initiation factor IF-2-like n=1 Tax=Schistocerca americana TaxID=7009 RepID=UPI001F503EFF|nr:translation initiation factor IF-2-like [Schistocerca americana]